MSRKKRKAVPQKLYSITFPDRAIYYAVTGKSVDKYLNALSHNVELVPQLISRCEAMEEVTVKQLGTFPSYSSACLARSKAISQNRVKKIILNKQGRRRFVPKLRAT